MFKKHLRDVTLQLGKISSAAVSTNMTAASSVSHSEMIEKLRNGIAFANTDVKMRPIYLDVQATTPMKKQPKKRDFSIERPLIKIARRSSP
uniref:H15 domain-containing protein n=1 Tax=Meloidogyne hapla TaxID=6305 RepID=A0A1I8B2L6_MELHA